MSTPDQDDKRLYGQCRAPGCERYGYPHLSGFCCIPHREDYFSSIGAGDTRKSPTLAVFADPELVYYYPESIHDYMPHNDDD